MSQPSQITVRFCEPAEPLRRFFTTFYLVTIATPPGQTVTDFLQPEWANLRIFSDAAPLATMHDGQPAPVTRFSVAGPSSHALKFEVEATRMWGIGLLPLGWARFVATPALDLANRAVDGFANPAFAGMAGMARTLFGSEPDPEAELARINAYFAAAAGEPTRDDARILAVHEALIDPDVHTVSDLVSRADVSQRTVERLCERVFGFSPKMLLRRQRFMRSLAQYMLDPSLRWIGALDGHYHDQAHFIRDFRQFMGMSPRTYAALDKPVLGAVMRARHHYSGRSVQTLDSPSGGSAPRRADQVAAASPSL